MNKLAVVASLFVALGLASFNAKAGCPNERNNKPMIAKNDWSNLDNSTRTSQPVSATVKTVTGADGVKH